MIYLGNKLNDAAGKYFQDKKKRPLVSELLRIVETENSKRKKKSVKEVKKEKEKKKEKKETAMSIAYKRAMLDKGNKKGSLGQKGQPF